MKKILDKKVNRVKQKKLYKMLMDKLFYHNGYLPFCGNCHKSDDFRDLEEYNRITAISITEQILKIMDN